MNTKISKLYTIVLMVLFSLILRAQTVTNFVNISHPDDLEVDAHGNLWVNYREGSIPEKWHLAKITPDGTLTNIITEDFELGQFGIGDNYLWITGSWGPNEIVYKYDFEGKKLDSKELPYSTEIILEKDGSWYVTQNALGQLTKVLPDKSVKVIASGVPLHYNLSLAKDDAGYFYTCNLMNSRVIKIDPTNGEKNILAELPSASPYSLGFLSYSNGYLYVPSFRHCIYKVNVKDGSFTKLVGSENTPGDSIGDLNTALFNNPIATAISNDGKTLYVTDSGNAKIKKITDLDKIH